MTSPFWLQWVEVPCRSVAVPRKMRVEYAGAIYPVMSRGDRGGDIFPDDVDRRDFLGAIS